MLQPIEGQDRPFDDTSIEDRFQYHAPSDEQLVRLQAMREAALAYTRVIMENLPNCRERSVALTKIEESSMWANKGAVFTEEVEVEEDAES